MTWSGRTDGEGPQHARWHQMISPQSTGKHIALMGFRSDEGVRRNQGRVGAAQGPVELRDALASMALHGRLGDGSVQLVDAGDVEVVGEALEAGQAEMGRRITQSLDAPHNLLTVVLGGGHETAWASYQGLVHSHLGATRWGVLNLDAHFDLRDAPRPTSGTPFWQMAAAERERGRALHYGVVGIAPASNTRVLFDRAEELGVEYLPDVDCTEHRVLDFVAEFCAPLEVVYLTIDLDVLPAAVAPGVSAPAAIGVPPLTILAAVRAVASTGKLRLLDVVELNPRYDLAGCTARTAARLINDACAVVAEA